VRIPVKVATDSGAKRPPIPGNPATLGNDAAGVVGLC